MSFALLTGKAEDNLIILMTKSSTDANEAESV